MLFLLTSSFAFPPEAITPIGQPVSLPPVIIATLMGGAAATIGYIVLTRFLAVPTARRVLLVLAIIVLIAMAFTPFGITEVPTAQIIILNIMHVVAGLVPVAALMRT